MVHCLVSTAMTLDWYSSVWLSCLASKRLSTDNNPKIMNKWPPWNICANEWIFQQSLHGVIKKDDWTLWMLWIKTSFSFTGNSQNLKTVDHCHKYLLLLSWTMWVYMLCALNELELFWNTIMYQINRVGREPPSPPQHSFLPNPPPDQL